MSHRRPDPPQTFPDRPEREQENLIRRRVRAFEDRTRTPGDTITWVVTLGAFAGVLLVLAFAFAGPSWPAWVPFLGLLVWGAIVSGPGGVNVISVLWGSDATFAERRVLHRLVYGVTAVGLVVAIVLSLLAIVRGNQFGWFGPSVIVVSVIAIGLIVRDLTASP